jgi:hypothetical protein
MEIYSPKAQKPDNFKKNTLRKKEVLMINRKSTLTGKTIEFKIDKEIFQNNIPRHNIVNSIFDYLKLMFYNRMKVFFDYEDKVKEKIKVVKK